MPFHLKSFIKPALTAAVAAACLGLPGAYAQKAPEPLKIGVILPLSGPFAYYGEQISNGIKVYVKEHGDVVAGRKIELIYKDDTGVAPEIDRRMAQELLVTDKADMLAGFALTPSALAAAPVATQAKRPMIVMNATSTIVPSRSPFIVRVSSSLPQVTIPLADWAYKNKIRKVYTMMADYAPGVDTEKAFIKEFDRLGGTIVGSVRVPITNNDFGSYVQKIKDVKPDAAFVFLPSASAAAAFVKEYRERGLREAGIRLLGIHDLADETFIDSLGDGIIGTITSGPYSPTHDSAVNRQFIKAYAEMFGPNARADYLSSGGYDGMAAIYAALKKTDGKTADGTKVIDAFRGLSFEGVRGPITIDPETRDITQNIYLRKVERDGNHLVNVEFETVPNVKAPKP